MLRSQTAEIMDSLDVPADELTAFHRDLARIHWLMGNSAAMLQRLNGARRVIDIGCGDGAFLAEIRRKTGAAVTGVELRAPGHRSYDVPIVIADATRDPLPRADVAVSLITIHHLSEGEVIDLIRNVGRYCSRFVFLDLVRHPLPLALFTLFMFPLVGRVTALDAQTSIRRAYTPAEMKALVARALEGTEATFHHWVSPVRARQIVDIYYAPAVRMQQ